MMLAKAVSECLRIDHKIFDLPKNFIEKYELLKNRMQDYEADENNYLIPLYEKVPRETKFCFTGTADLIVNARYLNEKLLGLLGKRDFRAIATATVRKRGLGFLRFIASTIPQNVHIRKQMSENIAIDRVEAELIKYKDYPDPVNTYYLFNRIRREIALADSNIFLGKSEPFSPYLENDFFTFFMSLPPTIKMDRQVLDAVFKKFYPDLHSIPFPHFMNENDQKKYYDNSLEIEKQLQAYSVQFMEQMRSRQMPWISAPFALFLNMLYVSERYGSVLSFLANTFIAHSVRKYAFPRYFTFYSVVRMVSMMDEWIRQYSIPME